MCRARVGLFLPLVPGGSHHIRDREAGFGYCDERRGCSGFDERACFTAEKAVRIGEDGLVACDGLDFRCANVIAQVMVREGEVFDVLFG